MSDLLNSASLVMIPSGYKEDVVYSQIPTDGSGDLSFTRASNGTRVNSAGLVEVCPWNLLQYSEQFTNAIWTPKSGTFTDNFATAPNGTQTAAKWQATDSDPYIYQAFNGVNVDYTATCWVKATGTAIGKNCSIRIGSDAVFTAMTGEWQQLTITANINGNENVGVEAPESATTGEIVYIWGFQLNIGSTAKPYFPTTDRLNVPRLTYQNGGGGCPSLLLEKQSTNLALYSEDFTQSVWSLLFLVRNATANTAISPDGTQNADTLADSITTAEFGAGQLITATNNIPQTVSVYLKANGSNFAMLRFYGNNIQYYYCVVVDLSTGTITKTQAGTSTSAVSSTITAMGNGWYRVTATATMNTLNYYLIVNLVPSATPTIGDFGNSSYTGTGNNSIYVYGAQLEASHQTSYIPTTSSSATRVADACYKTGISSLIGQSEGFIAGEVYGLTSAYGALSTIMSVSDGTTQNRVMFSFNPSTGYLTPRIYKAGSTIFVQDYYLGDLTQKIKFAIGWGGGRAVCYVNGTQVQETTGLTFFSSGTLTRLGADQGNGGSIGIGKVSEYILGTTNLTNSQLQSLTL